MPSTHLPFIFALHISTADSLAQNRLSLATASLRSSRPPPNTRAACFLVSHRPSLLPYECLVAPICARACPDSPSSSADIILCSLAIRDLVVRLPRASFRNRFTSILVRVDPNRGRVTA